MLSILKYLQNKDLFFSELLVRYGCFIPDVLYVKWMYRIKMGKRLNLKNPQSFNEKLQWLKLYNRKPEYTTMVDKITAKEYATRIIGEKYIIKTIKVWDRFEDINFAELPNEFVIKTSNGGGGSGVFICKNKDDMDKEEVLSKLLKSSKASIYKAFREWPYKDIKPRFFAEKLLVSDDKHALQDYKFFCFNGVVKALLVSYGRFEGATCFDYFDRNFNHLPFEQGGPNAPVVHSKPEQFDKMIELAEKLSSGLPHARVDLYEHQGKIYFGEITFFDSSGYAKFEPEEWDYKFGEWIDLTIV